MKNVFIANSGELAKEINRQIPHLNFNKIKQILRKKDIKINGIRTNKSVILKGGETIEVFYTLNEEKPKTVFEDQNVIIIFKPQGMECTLKDKVYLDKCVEEYFENCKCVHRLDRNTEGLLVLAKNENSYNELLKIFKNRQLHKYYKAICYGKFDKTENLLTGYATKTNEKTVISCSAQNGTFVKTYYKVEQKINKNLSLVNIELFTGFTHQIRAHLNTIGCFVLGDNKYGKTEINRKYNIKRQLLCCYKLVFEIKEGFLTYLNNITLTANPTFDIEKLKKCEN